MEWTFLNFGLNVVDLQVTGKAVMLDEIINYVQSLQRQVEVIFKFAEVPPWIFYLFNVGLVDFWLDPVICWCHLQFLSMKLSSVNPRMEFNMETLLSKDVSWSFNLF